MSGGSRWRDRIEGNVREIVFGLEDSLVSTLGAVTGIAAGTGNAFVVILSGVVLIFVEALSMSAGSYLSSKSALEVRRKQVRHGRAKLLQERVSRDESLDELLKRKKFSAKEKKAVLGLLQGDDDAHPAQGGAAVRDGFVMGLFYLSGGIFPLLPYFFLPVGSALIPSVVITGVVLFGIGAWKAKIVHTNALKSGLEMTFVSLTAALLGFLIGRAVALAFGITFV